ncbi:HD domain-containing protein [Desulfoluna spongiiphila]|uniref:HD/PDEase domain-containing protein n=1 Tax=Desulfoluna spongiiphila TaxID=419481 RepID=A0A1G5EKW0_9BACT|nr:HD domain-containing protein [Desulfoluna spongiiphila]SCY27582.1 hypothetical protein SAMN05216233_10678 [Desulfoluna spongiiphila]
MTVDLVTMPSHGAARNEVRALYRLTWPKGDGTFLEEAWGDVRNLYRGLWSGYHPCDTPYHNLTHVVTVTLAMARLLHGAVLDGQHVTAEEGLLCLVAALFHDAGLIRRVGDPETTGAELTKVHVPRGMEMLGTYLAGRGWDDGACGFARSLLACTELDADVRTIAFRSDTRRYLGGLLKAADLAGQMADGRYGEKILLLAQELRDADKEAFFGEKNLVANSPAFCRKALEELVDEGGKSVLDHFQTHFRAYRGMDRNVYTDQISAQISFLEEVIARGGDAYRTHLRNGAVKMGCPPRNFDAIYPKQ